MNLKKIVNDSGATPRFLRLFNDRFLTEQELDILGLSDQGKKYTGWWIFELNENERTELDGIFNNIQDQLSEYDGPHTVYFNSALSDMQKEYAEIMMYGSRVL